MKVNQSQIQALYAFTRKHYVEYYDLQTELVDHLANDIETMWQDQPKLSFEEAKTKAFKKFGIFGFMEALEQKQKAMSKRYRNYLWIEFKKWFAIPQIVITITLFLAFYIAFTTNYAQQFSISFYLLIVVWSTYKSFKLNRVFKRKKQKWLLEDLIFKQAGGSVLVFLTQIHVFFTISDTSFTNSYKITALALAFTILVLINYISLELLPNKAEKLLQETYPEFSL